MCGSGTIAIEGAMMARNIAPGGARQFAFEQWPDHDTEAWRAMRDKARSSTTETTPGQIIASDRDAGAVIAARENASRAGVSNDIEISESSVSGANYPDGKGFLVSNPPYGLRVGETAALRNLYAQLGKIIRERATGYRIALLSADEALEAQLGLDLTEAFQTSNGGIPVRLVVGHAE
jgi:putative N6-adenine-specific DNA methylase